MELQWKKLCNVEQVIIIWKLVLKMHDFSHDALISIQTKQITSNLINQSFLIINPLMKILSFELITLFCRLSLCKSAYVWCAAKTSLLRLYLWENLIFSAHLVNRVIANFQKTAWPRFILSKDCENIDHFLCIPPVKDTCYAWGKYSTSGYFGR